MTYQTPEELAEQHGTNVIDEQAAERDQEARYREMQRQEEADIIAAMERDERKLARMLEPRMIGVVCFTAGRVERLYGGPEEGGWYYDAFEPLRYFTVPAAKADRMRHWLKRWEERGNRGARPLHSVLSTGLRRVVSGMERRTPRPHYE